MRSGNHYKLNFNIYLMLYSFLDIFLIFITNGNLEITIPFILLCKSIYYSPIRPSHVFDLKEGVTWTK